MSPILVTPLPLLRVIISLVKINIDQWQILKEIGTESAQEMRMYLFNCPSNSSLSVNQKFYLTWWCSPTEWSSRLKSSSLLLFCLAPSFSVNFLSRINFLLLIYLQQFTLAIIFTPRKNFMGVELHGKTLGVVGCGRIGQVNATLLVVSLLFSFSFLFLFIYISTQLCIDQTCSKLSL